MNLKPIVGTVEKNSGKRLAKLFKELNVPFVNYPMIETNNVILNDEIKEIFDEIDKFDWLVFTSRNGVKSFLKLWNDYKKTSFVKREKNKIATIGLSTSHYLEEKGINTDFVNPGVTSGEFVHHIDKDEIIQNTHKVLLIQGNLAPDILYSKIKEITPSVKRINLYETTYKKDIDNNIYDFLEKEDYSLLLFTSPSSFDNFMRNSKSINFSKLRIAAIGKTTAKFISVRCKDAKVQFVPSRSEYRYLTKEIAEYINNNNI